MGYNILTDTEKSYEVMTAMQDQHQKRGEHHYTVQTPCCHLNVEVKHQSDQYLICECGQRYLLTHSAVGNKLYGE